MDPEEAYRQLCEAMEALANNEGDSVALSIDAQKAAEHWEALDGWLSRGGFLPGPWRKWREDARASGDAAGFIQGRRLVEAQPALEAEHKAALNQLKPPDERERVTFTNGTPEPMRIGDKVVAPGETVELHGATGSEELPGSVPDHLLEAEYDYEQRRRERGPDA